MKKVLIFFSLIILTIALSACTKTSVDENLEESRENQELLTNEEGQLLAAEDTEFQEDYMQALSEANEEKNLDESITLIDELENSKVNKKEGKAKGSCDAIESSSVCIEYYGSFWNEQEMRLHCEGSGQFSVNSCSNDMFGGCNTGLGTQADMVTWMYLRGNGEITPESAKYAKMACDATLASEWIEMK